MDHKWEFLKDTDRTRFGKPIKKYRCANCHKVVHSVPGILTDEENMDDYAYNLPQTKDGYPCLAGSWPSFSNLPEMLPGINYLQILVAQEKYKKYKES